MSGDVLTCALEGCANRFEPSRTTQKFCSPVHAGKARNNRRNKILAERTCDQCGSSYQPNRENQRYCSRRCSRDAGNSVPPKFPDGKLQEEAAKLGDDEIIRLAEQRGYQILKPPPPLPVTEVDIRRLKGGRFRVGIVSDTHFGSTFQQPTFLQEHLQYMKKQRVSAILVAGDVTDGSVKMHPGFVYETHTHGADAQVAYTLERWPDLGGIPHYFIAGNHDASHFKAAGTDVVNSICKERDDFTYLGPEIDSENFRGSIGYVDFGKVRIQLAHPHLGSTRTRSYRVERWVEELQPETKPNVLVMGNFHKSLTLDYRNVFSLMVPSYQAQSAWMASKGISSHIGGVILEFGEDAKGIAPAITVEWIIERVPRDRDY